MSRWWRAYDEAVDDPKLGALSDRQHRAWFNLCCITSQNKGKLPPIAAVAFKLRLTVDKAKALLAELVALKLFDIDGETGDVAPHNWAGRQFQSDVSTERVKRFRERRGNVSSAVSETPPETEADTEQRSSLRSDSARAKRGTRLMAGQEIASEFTEAAIALGANIQQIQRFWAEFVDYWCAVPGSRGTKLDWLATWRNRVRDQLARGQNGRRKTVHDAARELHEEFLATNPFDDPTPRSLCDGTGEDAVRLLPPGRRQ